MKIKAILKDDTERRTYTKKALYARTPLVNKLNNSVNVWVTSARYALDIENNRETVWLTINDETEIPVNVWGDSEEGILYDCMRAIGRYERNKRLDDIKAEVYRMAEKLDSLQFEIRRQDMLNNYDDCMDYMNTAYDYLIDITTAIEDSM